MPVERTMLRRALTAAVAAAGLTVGSVVGAGAASAHVHAEAEDAVRGEFAVVTFRVPNESETGSPTTKLIVQLPEIESASTRAMPGWASSLEHDAVAGTVRTITWSAQPGGGIQADQYEVFAVNVKLPNADTATFPVIQMYSDGTTVRWDEPPLVNGAEPEHPAPTLALLSAAGEVPDTRPGAKHERLLASLSAAAGRERELGPDNIARALGGGALLLAALGVGISLVRRRG
jgi:uncharacterized protein YcnI